MFNNKKFYKNPISYIIFLSAIFEKNIIKIYSKNRSLKKNFFIYFYNYNILLSMFFLLEYRSFYLNDLIASDFFSNIFKINKYLKNLPLLYSFYFQKTSSYFFFFNFNESRHSLAHIFYSFSWLEREVREFYFIKFKKQVDCRNLLLEYNFNKPVLLKKYKNVAENNYVSKYANFIFSQTSHSFFL